MERFTRYFMKSGNAAASYLKAGYNASSRTSLDSAASRLSRSCKVTGRIRELQKHMMQRQRITVDSLIDDLRIDRDAARELKQPSVAVSATMSMARLVGLLVDRKETGAPGDFAATSEAGVLERVRAELGDAAAAQLAAALAQAERQGEASEDEVDPLPIEPTHEGSSTPN